MKRIVFDDGPYPRARLAFVCVANAGLTEGEMFAMCPAGVGLSFTHMRMGELCTVENLSRMEQDIEECVSRFMNARDDIDVICYNCTSGSFVIGEEVIRNKLESGRDGARGTTLLTGVINALEALGVKRLSIGTAYTDDINALEKQYFESKAIDVVALQGLGLHTDKEMNRVSPRYLRDFACSVDKSEADAVFISCGALRSLEILDEVESILGKPVIASNQASLWHCLRLAGVNDRMMGFGSLLREF